MSKYRLTLIGFLMIMAILIVLVMQELVAIALPAVIAVGFLCFLGYAAFNIDLNFYVNSISSFQTTEGEIAITIDDSPSGDYTEMLLDVLAKHKVKASFFCIGKNIESHPEAFKALTDAGHFVGNHSYAHKTMMPFWKKNQIAADYKKGQDLLGSANHRNAFRPPFGITNPNIRFAINGLRLHSIGWNVRSFDTRINHRGRIISRILRRVKPGSILLFHDHQRVTVSVLDELIPILKEKNFSFITVDEILDRHIT